MPRPLETYYYIIYISLLPFSHGNNDLRNYIPSIKIMVLFLSHHLFCVYEY